MLLAICDLFYVTYDLNLFIWNFLLLAKTCSFRSLLYVSNFFLLPKVYMLFVLMTLIDWMNEIKYTLFVQNLQLSTSYLLLSNNLCKCLIINQPCPFWVSLRYLEQQTIEIIIILINFTILSTSLFFIFSPMVTITSRNSDTWDHNHVMDFGWWNGQEMFQYFELEVSQCRDSPYVSIHIGLTAISFALFFRV